MLRPELIAFVALTGLALSGCATITRGTTDNLLVQSEPDGASVELSSGQTCRTPCNLELKRKNDYTLYMRKEGFQDAEIKVESKVAGAGAAGMAGNVLIGGVIGAGVDAFSGATNNLEPNPVHVHLVARDPAQADLLCQLSDIATRLEWNLKFDPVKEKFVKDAEANRRLALRPMRKPWSLLGKV